MLAETVICLIDQVNPEDYRNASVDTVAQFTVVICDQLNKDRPGFTTSVMRKATGLDIEKAEFYRLDRFGFDVLCSYHGRSFNLRLPFPRWVQKKRIQIIE